MAANDPQQQPPARSERRRRLQERLTQGPPFIIDGGTGTELERLGAAMHPEAWCARTNLTDPEIVLQVHRSFLEAGAEILIANTYAANLHVMESAGLGGEFEPTNHRALELAHQARTAHQRAHPDHEIWVAGSMSTTTFSPGIDQEIIEAVATPGAGYRAQAAILAAGAVDLIILEMMRDVTETRLCLDAAAATGLPVWLGLSTEEDQQGRLVLFGSDIPLGDGLAQILEGDHRPQAVGVMHSQLTITPRALEVVKEQWSGPLFTYPHHGVFEIPHWRFDNTLSPAEFAAAGQAWLAAGAAAVGGCCGIRPQQIAALAGLL